MAASPLMLALCVVFLAYRYISNSIANSPLSKIPDAHPTSAFSAIWILWIRYCGKENVTVWEAHKRLGPMVRLGPNEISVNCVDGGIRSIYSGNYDKGGWYSNVFNNYGVDCLFSMERRETHTARKRMLSNIYAKSVLSASPAMAEICEELLCRRMLPRIANAPNGVLDAYELFCALTMDGVTAYLFGFNQSSNHTQSEDLGARWLRNYKARQDYMFFPQELPGLTRFLTWLGLRALVVPRWVDAANADIEAWALEMCDAAERAIVAGSPSSPGDEPVVYGQLRSMLKKQELHTDGKQKDTLTEQQRLEIASELLDHLAAGFDTSGITLTYLAWQLSRPHNAPVQTALQQELHSLKPHIRAVDESQNMASLPDPKDIDALPMLHAIVMETLRLHAAIPGGQPRVTPANATLGPPDAEVHGIPAGVRVVSYAHSLHRNPDIFPEPEEWRPERWLDTEGRVDTGGEKARWFWAFSSGGRMCIGSNLAMMEMKHIAAAIWSNFTTSVTDDTGMRPAGRYTDEPLGSPEGNYLLLRFESLDKGNEAEE